MVDKEGHEWATYTVKHRAKGYRPCLVRTYTPSELQVTWRAIYNLFREIKDLNEVTLKTKRSDTLIEFCRIEHEAPERE